jgi:hypothetical protein
LRSIACDASFTRATGETVENLTGEAVDGGTKAWVEMGGSDMFSYIKLRKKSESFAFEN